MVAFEYFKSNLATIEGNLANESYEATKHVTMYNSWVVWVRTNEASTEQYTEHLYRVSMPRVARSLLRRTFKDANDIDSVHAALKDFLLITMRQMHCIELASLLTVLLDHRQPFYVRHGYPTPKIVSANKRKFDSQSTTKILPAWQLELEEGSCVDVLHPTRGWELALVQQVIRASNEVKIAFAGDETVEYVRLDDPSRVAQYGTKIGLFDDVKDTAGNNNSIVFEVEDDDEPSGSEPMAVDSSGSVAQDTTLRLSRLAVESSIASQWRSTLRRGSFVDVKIKTGSWQQACILELRDVVLVQAKCLDSAAPDGVEKHPPEQEIMEIDSSTPMAGEPETNNNTIKATFARVAFLGMSEGSDEWVDIFDATAVQTLDSMSGGKRGDGVVRDELIYIVSTAEPLANADFSYLPLRLLYSPFYLEMISLFLEHQGYEFAASYIVHSMTNTAEYQALPLDVILHLIISVGQFCVFIDKKQMRLNPELTELLSKCIGRLKTLTAQEIRETSTDLLDQVLLAIEDIVFVVFGRTMQGGQVMESVVFIAVAKMYLLCPFLNRRLWGLKKLTELIQRCRAKNDFPDGIRAVRTFANSAKKDSCSQGCEGDAVFDPVKELKAETVSYRVVKIAHAISAADLCKTITKEAFVTQIFVGETAHASLMQRTTEVLRFLAAHGYLSTDVLMHIWEVGFILREPIALQVLVDIIQDLPFAALQLLVDTVALVPSDALTANLVEIISAIAQRLHLSTPSGEKNAALILISAENAENSPDAADSLFVRCLMMLWHWCSDNNSIDDTCTAKALVKLEHLIGTCMSAVNALHRISAYDWNRHWERTVIVVKVALKELTGNKSIVPALKVIQAAIMAWPKMPTSSAVLGLAVADKLPFEAPTRSSVAEYFEGNVNVLQLISEVVVQLKEDFSLATREITGVSGGLPHDFDAAMGKPKIVSSEVQSALDQTVVGTSRSSFSETLEKCFDFINFFARCSMGGNIKLRYELVENIFNVVLRSAVTLKERDAVISFLSRLIQVRNLSSSHKGKSEVSSPSTQAPADATERSSIHNGHNNASSILELSDVGKVFRLLLCDKKFIESPQLNSNGFNCIERYFRWMNADNGDIVEFVGHDAKYMVCKNLCELQGWDAFLRIVLCCHDVTVAMQAIKFFTSVVNKFSIPLIEQGEIGRHYQMLVDLSMNMLGRLKRDYESSSAIGSEDVISVEDVSIVSRSEGEVLGEQVGMRILEHILACGDSSEHSEGKGGEEAEWVMVGDAGSDEDRRRLVFQRILLLLTAILDESSTDTGRHNIQSHDARSRSEPVELKLTGAGKKKCLNISSIQMLMTDRLGDLLSRVEQNLLAPTTLANVKVFHRGKDLSTSSANDRLKTLKDLFFTSTETLMIVERPNAVSTAVSSEGSVSTKDSVSSASNGKDQKGFVCNYTLPMDALPIVLLSRNEKYFDILFSMLNYTSGELTTALWTLIMRLPTSHSYLLRWSNLDSHDTSGENGILELLGVEGIIIDAETEQQTNSTAFVEKRDINVSRLVYSLQIIENIMDSPVLEGEGIATISTVDWIQGFVDKGGLNALVLAMLSTSERLGIYQADTKDQSFSGASGIMLLQALSGLSKLVRFFLILLCNSTKSSEAIVLLGPLLTRSAARKAIFRGDLFKTPAPSSSSETSKTGKKSAAAATSDYVEDLTVDDIFGDSGSKDTQRVDPENSEGAETKGGGEISDGDASFSAEWGSQFFGAVRITQPERNLLLITQEMLLSSFRRIRHYSDSATGPSESKTGLSSSDLSLDETHLSNCAENFLVLWGSLLIIDSSVCVEASKEEILVPFLSAVCRSTRVENSGDNFPARLTAWFMECLVNLFELLKDSNREHYGAFCRGVLTSSLTLRPSLTNLGSSNVSKQHPLPEISLICQVLEFGDRMEASILSEAARAALGSGILLELQQYAVKVRDSADKSADGASSVVNGSLQLLCTLARGHDGLLQVLYQDGAVQFLVETCLGLEQTSKVNLWSLCPNTDGKTLSYTLLLILASWRREVAQEISEKVRVVHNSAVEALQCSEEVGSKKNKTDSTGSVTREMIKGAFRPERDIRSSIGYSGIRNLGCTCYMNSLLQVLYMIPEVRRGVLEFPVDANGLSDEAKADNLVLQLQRMFIYLSNSQRKAYNPESWAAAYKDESGVLPINVTQQQDAQEFLQVLCERLESQYFIPNPGNMIDSEEASLPEMVVDGGEEKATGRRSDGVKFNVMQRAFGGKLSNQMMRTGGESDIREKEESFVCISLDVAGTAGLESSLNKFVAGETIADFQWDEGMPRETIIKRQCLDELSNTVIFHLKRFELNFDTFLREKVNDVFPFPTFLNLFPYSKEGLAAKVQGKETVKSLDRRPESYYQYELQGIVVHTGTTDSGHYFSYIRETDMFEPSLDAKETAAAESKKRWIEFNDSEVSSFSESLIASECFGGMTTVYDISNKDIIQRSSLNPKNAYMLVYRRVHPVEEKSAVDADVVSKDIVKSSAVFQQKLRDEIDTDNHRHVLCSRIFAQPHIKFMSGLFDSFKAQGGLDKSTWSKEGTYVGKSTTILEDFVIFSLKIVARTVESKLYSDLAIRIIETVVVPKENDHEAMDVSPENDLNKENVPVSTSEMDTSADEEAAALALSLSLQTASAPSPDTEVSHSNQQEGGKYVGDETIAIKPSASFDSTVSKFNVAVDVMNVVLADLDVVCSLLFHTDVATRMATSRMLFTFYAILASGKDSMTHAVLEAVPNDVWKDGVLSSTQIAVPADMEVDAGKITDISEISNSSAPAASLAKSEEALDMFLSNNTSPGIICIKFLLQLTRDDMVQAIAEHWRRSDAICFLINSVAQLNWQSRYVLARREMIAAISDIFLGDQSVTGGGLFVQGSRKRAASSYAHVPHVKPGTVNHHAKNIPDWTLLLDALALLVTSSFPQSQLNAVLDDLSVKSMRSKVFFSTSLKQARYCPALCKIMRYNCFENVPASTDFAEAIGETLSMCSSDAVYHIFNVISEFFSIPDRFAATRVGMLFSGQLSVLDMAKSCQDSRAAFVSVFIQSMLALADKNANLYTNLSFSGARIEAWAGWMLKFSYQYQGKTRAEADSLAALKGTVSSDAPGNKEKDVPNDESKISNTPAKGPYLPIFGEPESSFETPAAERAELCFQSLRNMLLRMGANPEFLIPDDAFIELPPDEGAIGAAFDLTHDDPIEIDGQVVAPGGDHMTDEEFARFLASQEQ